LPDWVSYGLEGTHRDAGLVRGGREALVLILVAHHLRPTRGCDDQPRGRLRYPGVVVKPASRTGRASAHTRVECRPTSHIAHPLCVSRMVVDHPPASCGIRPRGACCRLMSAASNTRRLYTTFGTRSRRRYDLHRDGQGKPYCIPRRHPPRTCGLGSEPDVRCFGRYDPRACECARHEPTGAATARQLVSAPRKGIEGDSGRARSTHRVGAEGANGGQSQGVGPRQAHPQRGAAQVLHVVAMGRWMRSSGRSRTRLAVNAAAPAGRGAGDTAPRPATPRAAQPPRPAGEGLLQSAPSAAEEHFRHASQDYSSWSAVEDGALDGHGASCVRLHPPSHVRRSGGVRLGADGRAHRLPI